MLLLPFPSFADTIGAWYFTLWHQDAASGQLDAAKRLYGAADAWGGVREYAAGHGALPIIDTATGRAVDYRNRQPLTGFYDLSAPGVIDTQLAEGAKAGLSFFAFYYYVDGATGQPMPVSSPVRAFYGAPDHHGLSLLLAPIVNPNGGVKLTFERFRAVLLPILTDYLASPAALRIDGRPALVDWGFDTADPVDDMPAIYAALRQSVRARTGRDPFLIKLLGARAGVPDIAYAIAHLHPDAFTCFVFPMTPGEPYGEWAASYAGRMRAQVAGVGATPYLPCAGTGQDARPWFHIGWGAPTMDARGYTTGITPAAFRTALLGLRSFMENRNDPMRVAIVYAWNEWGEAEASIEPSKAEGYAYADIVRQVFGGPGDP